MNVYLVRHAHALAVNPPEIASDEDRPLSDLGRQQVRWLAKAFKRLKIVPDRVATSPLLRARETAQGLVKELSLGEEAADCKALAPGNSSKRLAKYLLRQEGDHIVLVGHEPDLGRHAAWLIGSKQAQVAFAKGGAACLVCEGVPGKGNAMLTWLITPEFFQT